MLTLQRLTNSVHNLTSTFSGALKGEESMSSICKNLAPLTLDEQREIGWMEEKAQILVI